MAQQGLRQITGCGDNAADMRQDSDSESHLNSSSLRAAFTHKNGLNLTEVSNKNKKIKYMGRKKSDVTILGSSVQASNVSLW